MACKASFVMDLSPKTEEKMVQTFSNKASSIASFPYTLHRVEKRGMESDKGPEFKPWATLMPLYIVTLNLCIQVDTLTGNAKPSVVFCFGTEGRKEVFFTSMCVHCIHIMKMVFFSINTQNRWRKEKFKKKNSLFNWAGISDVSRSDFRPNLTDSFSYRVILTFDRTGRTMFMPVDEKF